MVTDEDRKRHSRMVWVVIIFLAVTGAALSLYAEGSSRRPSTSDLACMYNPSTGEPMSTPCTNERGEVVR